MKLRTSRTRPPNVRFVSGLVAAVVAFAVVAVVTVVAGAVPRSFELTFEGSHPAAVHEGPFTASAPFCAAGYAADRPSPQSTGPPPVVTRDYTCGDGTGTVTMLVDRPHGEHSPGGTGRWKIVEGSGHYARLRGQGTWTSSGGDPRFRSVLSGIVDFDTGAPVVAISRATTQKLRRPRGAYLLRATFSARDDVEGNTVSYRVVASAGGLPLVTRTGKTTSRQVSLSLRVRPPARARTLTLEISASDAVENERRVSRALKLRR